MSVGFPTFLLQLSLLIREIVNVPVTLLIINKVVMVTYYRCRPRASGRTCKNMGNESDNFDGVEGNVSEQSFPVTSLLTVLGFAFCVALIVFFFVKYKVLCPFTRSNFNFPENRKISIS